MNIEAGFHSVYSKKHGDLIGFMLVSGDDVHDQAFVVTFLTKSNEASKALGVEGDFVTFNNSLFGSIKFKVDNPDIFTELILNRYLIPYYTGFKDGVTPRIAYIAKNRDGEEITLSD